MRFVNRMRNSVQAAGDRDSAVVFNALSGSAPPNPDVSTQRHQDVVFRTLGARRFYELVRPLLFANSDSGTACFSSHR
jgi:hypothetical protein